MSEGNDFIYMPRFGAKDVQRIALTTSGGNTALEEHLAHVGWLRITVVGCNVQAVGTNSDSDAVVFGATTSTADDVGTPLLNGANYEFYNTYSRIAWDADGSGYMVITRSGRKRTGQVL